MVKKVRIEIRPASHGTRVFLDDQEILGLAAVDVRAESGKASRVTLTFLGAAVEIVGEVGQLVEVRTPLDADAREFRPRDGEAA